MILKFKWIGFIAGILSCVSIGFFVLHFSDYTIQKLIPWAILGIIMSTFIHFTGNVDKILSKLIHLFMYGVLALVFGLSCITFSIAFLESIEVINKTTKFALESNSLEPNSIKFLLLSASAGTGVMAIQFCRWAIN